MAEALPKWEELRDVAEKIAPVLSKEEWCLMIGSYIELLMTRRRMLPRELARQTGLTEKELKRQVEGVSCLGFEKVKQVAEFFGSDGVESFLQSVLVDFPAEPAARRKSLHSILYG